MIVRAGEEGVAALDAMDEALFDQKIEGAIDGDRRRPRHAFRQFLDHVVSAERTMARQQGFEHAAAQYYLATRDGRTVGRIAAISNRLHNEVHGDKVGFFGWFECDYDQEAADALFAAAAQWLKDHGHDVMRGPASFSVNDECGLLVDGFDTPPTLMMPHNPPYYLRLMDGAGFRKAKDLWVYRGGYASRYIPVPERLSRGTELIQKRQGVTLRPFNMGDFNNEVAKVKELYNKAWEKN